jgi:hypothetical protein
MPDPEDYATWLKVFATLDEARARWFVAQKVLELGRGGVKQLHQLTGLSRPTILRGIRELQDTQSLDPGARVRRPGGGRKKLEATDPTLLADLERVMEEATAGDPMSHLRWTNKSTAGVASELRRLGHRIGPDTVGRLLKEMDYTLQANVKSKEGESHPDRDAQFWYINRQYEEFATSGDPVISVDAKKRERVGEFKNPGRTWRKSGQSREVWVYDFINLGIGPAIPYGAYDPRKNHGFVNVGMIHDTAEFAVESIRRWWGHLGSVHSPEAKRLLICADGGGSNGSRVRGWKSYLQVLADQIGRPITVCHYPPGTSKWNKIEHRMFSFISLHWKGEPLVSYETVVKLISTMTTETGLKVEAMLDETRYECKKKITREEMKQLKIEFHQVHPRWNYTISPRCSLQPGRAEEK